MVFINNSLSMKYFSQVIGNLTQTVGTWCKMMNTIQFKLGTLILTISTKGVNIPIFWKMSVKHYYPDFKYSHYNLSFWVIIFLANVIFPWGEICEKQAFFGLGSCDNVTRASRTTGAKGSNSFARNNRVRITDDHIERIRLQVSANNK